MTGLPETERSEMFRSSDRPVIVTPLAAVTTATAPDRTDPTKVTLELVKEYVPLGIVNALLTNVPSK